MVLAQTLGVGVLQLFLLSHAQNPADGHPPTRVEPATDVRHLEPARVTKTDDTLGVVLARTPELNRLLVAYVKTGVFCQINGLAPDTRMPITIYAPAEHHLETDAFETMITEEDTSRLKRYLALHLGFGRVNQSKFDTPSHARVNYGNRPRVKLDRDELGRPTVNGVVVLHTIEAANGVIHIIDGSIFAMDDEEAGESEVAAPNEATSDGPSAWSPSLSAESRAVALQHGSAEQAADTESKPTFNRATSGETAGVVLAEFHADKVRTEWIVVNDNVMGGKSSGGPAFNDGVLTFTGLTNTNGGGFSSIRTVPGQWDLAEYDGIFLRVRGDGRTYLSEIRTDVTFRGRAVAYRAEFKTEEGDGWQEIVVPFAKFEPSSWGRDVSDQVDALDTSDIKTLGFMIYDGLDGAFKLEVDWIKAVKIADERRDETTDP